MINNNYTFLPVFRTDSEGKRITRSPAMDHEQWKKLRDLIAENATANARSPVSPKKDLYRHRKNDE